MAESFADWKAEGKPQRAEVPVCFDRALLANRATIKRELAEVDPTGNLGDPAREREKELTGRLSEIDQQIREKTRMLVFEDCGKTAWRKLLSEHPPTTEQAAEPRNQGFNPDTFIPGAISLCCTAPGMAPDEAVWLIENMPDGVVNRVWAAVLEVRLGGMDDPFVAASDGARAGAKK